jgi:PAS domain S-box-containing protein
MTAPGPLVQPVPAPPPGMQIDSQIPPGHGDLSAFAVGGLPLLRALFDGLPARVLACDPAGHLLYANHEFFTYTGLVPEAVLGRHIAEVVSPETWKTYGPVRERAMRGEAVRWEGWVDFPSHGGQRYMHEQVLPCSAPGGPVQAVVVITRDLTSLKRREAELDAHALQLQASEAIKAAIVDKALAAIVTTDGDGRVVEFNPAAEAMFGLPRAQAVGRTVAEVMIPPRHQAAHDAGMRRMAAGAAPRVMGKRLAMHALRASGEEFPIEMVLWRTDVAGSSYYTASINDMSERQRAEEVIERQREALRQSEKLSAMGSLLAGVAHELNNPLAIVMGRASLLEDKTAGTPLAADAARIRDAAERCGRIVRTFLNMARSKPAQRAPVAVNELVTAAVDMMQYSLRSHGISVLLALADELPTVNADADQIGQVVLNLIVNAQQALAAHDGPRRISIRSGVEARAESASVNGTRRGAAREPRVWLRVADSGPGVAPELRTRIFEPFFTTKPEGLGTGLGLAVSRSLLRDHGGEMMLEDSAEGACFRVSLPISGEAAGATVPAALEEAPAESAARVLVVDDEPEIAALMRDLLETAGYDVLSAESGAVALALLAETPVDAIVSDLRMPEVDGAALWREVRLRWPALARRMLFVTGDTLSPAARSFLAETGCASLDKPFARADLLERVRDMLAS